MKKFLSIVMVAVALLIGNAAVPQTMPQASAQEYWGGDTNYPLLSSSTDFSWYLDSASVVVKKNIYQGTNIDRVWAANVITVNKNSGTTFTHTYWFCDYCGTMYYSIDNGDWVEFDPMDGNHDYMARVRSQACKLSWRIAFGSVFS